MYFIYQYFLPLPHIIFQVLHQGKINYRPFQNLSFFTPLLPKSICEQSFFKNDHKQILYRLAKQRYVKSVDNEYACETISS